MTFFFKCPFLSVFVGFGIGATIGTHQENQCLPYAVLFYIPLDLCGFFIIIFCEISFAGDAQTLPDDTSPIGKILPVKKIAVTFEPIM